MKKTIYLMFAIIAMALCSCSEEFFEEPADKFVGVYEGTAKIYMEAIGISETGTDEVIIQLTKTSYSGLKMTGYFNTLGEVDGNIAYFDNCSEVDEEGTCQYTFSKAYLENGVLSFTVNANARLSIEGVTIPATAVVEVKVAKNTTITKTRTAKGNAKGFTLSNFGAK